MGPGMLTLHREHCKPGSVLPQHSTGAFHQPPDLSAPRHQAEVGIKESKGPAIQAAESNLRVD